MKICVDVKRKEMARFYVAARTFGQQTPFWNVYSTVQICIGTAPAPQHRHTQPN